MSSPPRCRQSLEPASVPGHPPPQWVTGTSWSTRPSALSESSHLWVALVHFYDHFWPESDFIRVFYFSDFKAVSPINFFLGSFMWRILVVKEFITIVFSLHYKYDQNISSTPSQSEYLFCLSVCLFFLFQLKWHFCKSIKWMRPRTLEFSRLPRIVLNWSRICGLLGWVMGKCFIFFLVLTKVYMFIIFTTVYLYLCTLVSCTNCKIVSPPRLIVSYT